MNFIKCYGYEYDIVSAFWLADDRKECQYVKSVVVGDKGLSMTMSKKTSNLGGAICVTGRIDGHKRFIEKLCHDGFIEHAKGTEVASRIIETVRDRRREELGRRMAMLWNSRNTIEYVCNNNY